MALRSTIRSVLEVVTIANLITGELPASVIEMTEAPDAWTSQ